MGRCSEFVLGSVRLGGVKQVGGHGVGPLAGNAVMLLHLKVARLFDQGPHRRPGPHELAPVQPGHPPAREVPAFLRLKQVNNNNFAARLETKLHFLQRINRLLIRQVMEKIQGKDPVKRGAGKRQERGIALHMPEGGVVAFGIVHVLKIDIRDHVIIYVF